MTDARLTGLAAGGAGSPASGSRSWLGWRPSPASSTRRRRWTAPTSR